MNSDTDTAGHGRSRLAATEHGRSNLYQSTLSPLIVQIILVVVALGLLDVSLDYVGRALHDIAILGEARFWQRVVLLLSVLAFTTYNLISYSTEAATTAADAGWNGTTRTPGRVVGLFLLDLLQVAVLGWMYVSLLVGEPGEQAIRGADRLTLEPIHFVFIATLAGCWHVLVLLWHWVAGSRGEAMASHARFTLMFWLIAATAVLLPSGAWTWPGTPWMLLAGFVGTVVVLFATRGRRVLSNALSDGR